MQLLLSIQTFHNMGYTHNDTHLGNFLIHKIKPGGYWHYKYKPPQIHKDIIDIYVPNTGYLLVLWDPGIATKKKNPRNDVYYEIDDMIRPLDLINNIVKYDKYIAMGLKPIPQNLQDMNTSIISLLINYYELYSIFTKLNDKIPGLLTNDKSPIKSLIINEKPYTLNYIEKPPKVIKIKK
jgi:hypothetical protein